MRYHRTMKASLGFLNCIVAAFIAAGAITLPIGAQAADVDDLLTRLPSAKPREALRLEREIATEWSKSGSASMDLLLQRGRDAMDEGDMAKAIGHLTALTDHAPDFAEGWYALATAYHGAGKHGPSMAALSRALTLNPKNFNALAGLALILDEVERPKDALAAYRAALAIHPHLVGVSDAVKRLETKVAGTDL